MTHSSLQHLRGLPHLILASGQTIPNILGMKELGSISYGILHTRGHDPDKLRHICRAFNFREIIAPVEIDEYDVNRTGVILSDLRDRLHGASRQGWVWNYTAGTKQMFLGIMKGLAVEDPGTSPIRESIYLDTKRKGFMATLFGSEHYPLSVRLTVHELLTAHGILQAREGDRLLTPLVFTSPLPGKQSPPFTDDRWIRLARTIAGDIREVKSFIEKQRSQHSGKSFTIEQCNALIRRLLTRDTSLSLFITDPDLNGNLLTFLNGIWLEIYIYGLLLEAWRRDKIDDVQWSLQIKRWDSIHQCYHSSDTDIDVSFTRDNNFFFISCKTEKNGNLKDELFRVAIRREQFGGSFARGTLVTWHRDNGNLADQGARLKVTVADGELLKKPATLLETLLNST